MDDRLPRDPAGKPSRARQPIDWSETRESLRQCLPLVWIFIGACAFEYVVGYDNVWNAIKGGAKDGLAIAQGIIAWTAAALVALAAGRLLWPYLRPFVCVALGVITLWVIWRLGLW